MGSFDLHHQDELHGSFALAPDFHVLAHNHDLLYSNQNHNLFLNCNEFSNTSNGDVFTSQRIEQNDQNSAISMGSNIVLSQKLGLPLPFSASLDHGFMNQIPAHQIGLGKFRDELLLPHYIPKLSQANDYNDNQTLASQGLISEEQKLLLRTLTSECKLQNVLQAVIPTANLSSSTEPTTMATYSHDHANVENFGMAFSNANVADHLSSYTSLLQGSLGVELQDLEMSTSNRLARSFYHNSFEDIPYRINQFDPVHYQKMPTLVSRVTDANRRLNDSTDNQIQLRSTQTGLKRPRLEQRSPFSPFKVRKEKLGDRIAALQQLVAPFGKTDTASVLMEAIGYIKFLQEQVETLSVPYMGSIGNKKSNEIKEVSNDNGRDQMKLDLRSRGLCLVPLSCTSYITGEHGGAWPPTNYRGNF